MVSTSERRYLTGAERVWATGCGITSAHAQRLLDGDSTTLERSAPWLIKAVAEFKAGQTSKRAKR